MIDRFVWAMAALSALMAGQAWAQQPSPPTSGFPPGGPPVGAISADSPGGSGTTVATERKLLAPLPPPSAEVLKQNPPSRDPHILEGVWLSEPYSFPAGGRPQLPLTEAAKQHMAIRAQRQREANAQGRVLLTESGRCRPMESIGIGTPLFPAEIVQTPDKIIVLSEEGRGRWVIHLIDQHPKDVKPTYFGHSVGHWENDTLVVDTIGLRSSEIVFGKEGLRSDKARVVSRLRKFDGGQKLELISTTYDSEIYSRPVDTDKAVSSWHPELSLLEFQCEENTKGAREGMVD